MQIDFHHAVTYTIGRIAGLDHHSSAIVGYAAQYVDDSTTSGFLRFDNGMRYQRHATAHPMLNPDNLDNDDNALSWLPFHFLPGADDADHYYDRLICRPDSPVAKAMIASAICAKDRPHGLHRLGIAAHVFVDTFAHQGFVGQRHPINNASEIQDSHGKSLPAIPVPPIGHGLVGSYPDQPYLRWSYMDTKGKKILRDNPKDFLLASNRLCQEFRRYLLGDPSADVPGLGAYESKIALMFEEIVHADGDARHKTWTEALAADHFGFGTVNLQYEGVGVGSWKHHALGDEYLKWHNETVSSTANEKDLSIFQRIGAEIRNVAHKAEALASHLGVEPPTFKFSPAFLDSDYKRFHDAAREQRHAVFTEILPSFGICAA